MRDASTALGDLMKPLRVHVFESGAVLVCLTLDLVKPLRIHIFESVVDVFFCECRGPNNTICERVVRKAYVREAFKTLHIPVGLTMVVVVMLCKG